MALTKSLYALPTWSRTVMLLREHAALREAIGCTDETDVPSVYAAYRFTAKLRRFKPLLDACMANVTAALQAQMPGLGRDVAIDASDLPAYANGQRFVSKGGRERERFSDPDASWGHRSAVSTRKGGGFYGYRSTLLWTRPPTCRWRGGWSRPTCMSRCWPSRCWTRPARKLRVDHHFASGP